MNQIRIHVVRYDPKDSHQRHLHLPCHLCGKIIGRYPCQVKNHVAKVHDKVRNYKCYFCGSSFYDKAVFQQHFSIHTREKPLKCGICHEEFNTTYGHHVTHENLHFSSKLYKTSVSAKEYRASNRKLQVTFSCVSCNENFPTFAEIEKHIKPFVSCLKCDQCGFGFGSVNEKAQHFETDELKCIYCFKEFHTKCALNNHKKSHNSADENNSQCPHCPAIMSNFLSLKFHIQKFHSVQTKFNCDSCKIVFNNQLIQKCHESVVHSGKEDGFTCHICGTLIPGDFRNYGNHIYFAHSSPLGKCVYCGRKTHQHWLRNHVISHIRREAHKRNEDCICPVCKQAYNTPEKMITHYRVCQKRGKIRFVCQMCGKRFHSGKTTFEDHLRRHLQEKSCKCHVCGKDFVTGGDLVKHLKSHSELRPYACKFCGKTFKIVENKRRHEATVHSTSKVPCLICGKMFPHKNYLRDHMPTHSEEKMFKCKLCKKAFTCRPNMYRHVREVHK